MRIQKKVWFTSALALLLVTWPGYAQDSAAPPNSAASGGWRKFGDPAPAAPQSAPAEQAAQSAPVYQGAPAAQSAPVYQGAPAAQSAPVYQGAPPYQGAPAYQNSQGAPNYQTQPGPYAPPPQELTLPAGTWITVRLNQPLSSDHNQPGDTFTATLAEPIVASGRVVARRGQTVAGRVEEARKAGTVNGTSRLGLQLTELSLVDGRQVPMQTQLVERSGQTSVGRDAAAIGTTTGLGAIIGGAAAGGRGAGVGAIAGAAASTIGVLLTRGKSTVVYPETLLTFRLQAPVAIDSVTDAFTAATQQDYNPAPQGLYGASRPAPVGPPPYAGGYYSPYPYPYPYVYGYPYYGAYGYGPSLYLRIGPRFGYRGYRRR